MQTVQKGSSVNERRRQGKKALVYIIAATSFAGGHSSDSNISNGIIEPTPKRNHTTAISVPDLSAGRTISCSIYVHMGKWMLMERSMVAHR